MRGAVTANLYEILGVAPGAEDAVIRAAYRALIRIYHPDRNDDPVAQARARDVTAAFAILGDPAKRAAYDEQSFSAAMPFQHRWVPVERGSPPMRNLGLASIAVALAVSVAFALPTSHPLAQPESLRNLIAYRSIAVAVPPLRALASRTAPQFDQPLVAHVPAARPHLEAPTPPTAKASPAARPSSTPRPVETDLVPAPAPSALAQPEAAAAQTSSEQRAQMERLAAGFLKQSLEHADQRKQQLLLSAGTRAAAARNMCRSDDCAASAYLREIRDTTAIMEGRVPNP